MKKLLCCCLVLSILFALAGCYRLPEVEYHPSGFENAEILYINIDGKTHAYERYQAGTGSLTKKAVLDRFITETEIEGVAWEVYSTKEYPDLSYVLVISGTNSAWTYRILEQAS